MKKNKLQKKAITAVYWVIYGLVIGLCTFYFFYTFKSVPQNTEFVGQVFLNSYKETQNSLKDMYYIKKSAEYSTYNSLYPFTKRGFCFKEPKCLIDESGYTMWENIIGNKDVQCYPTEKEIEINFALFLNEELNKYFETYTQIIIPKNNYDFTFNEKKDNTEITGIATQKIITPVDPTAYKGEILPTLPKEEQDCLSKEGHVSFFMGDTFTRCGECPEEADCKKYTNEIYCNIDPCNLGCIWKGKCKRKDSVSTITPSFKTEMSYKLITKFTEYSTKAQEIRDNIQDCLEKGSQTPDDKEDLLTCSNIKKLKTQIEGIENYQIIPIAFPEDYTLLFDIEDSSSKNPYSEEKLVIKYGLRFLDKFPPPATEIMTDKNNKPLKKDGAWYLIWETNNASDVVGYKIYYKKIEKTLDEREIPPTPPTNIEKMDNKDSPIVIRAPFTEWLITGLEGDYYFFIIAVDDANNIAYDIITKRVVIPPIEEAKQEDILVLY